MDFSNPTINNLFEQLGLSGEDEAIDQFIEEHRGLNKETYLYQADFWNASQRKFLKDAWREDAEWAPAIDQLNTRLR